MSQNSNPSLLDAPQIIKRVFDDANDSYRVILSDNHTMSLSLSAISGDSVTTYPSAISSKASITNANTGVILAAQSCVGMKSFELYTNTTATLTGAQVCTLEISPSDTDNIWISSSLTITPSGTNATVVAGTVNSSIVARRCRVSIASAISTGTFDIYLVAQAV